MQDTLMKSSFDEELSFIKSLLPKRYGTIVVAFHPEVELRDIYNVVHGHVRNWQILGYLKEIPAVKTKLKELKAEKI